MYSSLYFLTSIRFYAACVYSGCDRASLYSNSSVCPRLNDFIRTLKWCFVFISLVSSNHGFIFNVVIVINSCGVVNYVFSNLCLSLTYVSQILYMIDWEYHVSPQKLIGPDFFCLVPWYVPRTVKAASARIPIYGSASSTYVPCRLYVRTILPSTWCILYMVAFTYEFPGEAVLVLILYSCSIKLLFTSWTSNYPPW